MKNTCICGISRDNTPSPRLNSNPNTYTKRGCDDARHVLRRVAHKRQFARLKDFVAVIHRRDHQMVQISGKHQSDTEHGQKISDQKALLVLGRIDSSDEPEAQLLGNDRSGYLER